MLKITGSCWAFSATGGIEGINAIATGELVSVSEQELVDCDTASDGCDGGYMDYAFEWVIQNGGIDSESDYGYTSYSGNSGVCNVTKAYKVVSIDGYEDVPDDESALLCAVAGQPVSVGLDASSLDFQLYTGGIFYGNCSSDPDDIDHGVLIVGYGSEGGQDYWIVKNSWGTSWGDNGYFYLKRDTGLNHGQCAVNSLASYPTKGVLATPSPYPSPATPPPPSLPPPPPPPPSPPSPEQCGDGTYCNHGETCCCIFELADICFLHGCCGYENAVCCEDSDFCCPQDYPVCDVLDGICLKNPGDFLGVKMKKRRFAKRKFPWTKFDDEEKEASQPPELTWRDEGIAAV